MDWKRELLHGTVGLHIKEAFEETFSSVQSVPISLDIEKKPVAPKNKKTAISPSERCPAPQKIPEVMIGQFKRSLTQTIQRPSSVSKQCNMSTKLSSSSAVSSKLSLAVIRPSSLTFNSKGQSLLQRYDTKTTSVVPKSKEADTMSGQQSLDSSSGHFLPGYETRHTSGEKGLQTYIYPTIQTTDTALKNQSSKTHPPVKQSTATLPTSSTIQAVEKHLPTKQNLDGQSQSRMDVRGTALFESPDEVPDVIVLDSDDDLEETSKIPQMENRHTVSVTNSIVKTCIQIKCDSGLREKSSSAPLKKSGSLLKSNLINCEEKLCFGSKPHTTCGEGAFKNISQTKNIPQTPVSVENVCNIGSQCGNLTEVRNISVTDKDLSEQNCLHNDKHTCEDVPDDVSSPVCDPNADDDSDADSVCSGIVMYRSRGSAVLDDQTTVKTMRGQQKRKSSPVQLSCNDKDSSDQPAKRRRSLQLQPRHSSNQARKRSLSKDTKGTEKKEIESKGSIRRTTVLTNKAARSPHKSQKSKNKTVHKIQTKRKASEQDLNRILNKTKAVSRSKVNEKRTKKNKSYKKPSMTKPELSGPTVESSMFNLSELEHKANCLLPLSELINIQNRIIHKDYVSLEKLPKLQTSSFSSLLQAKHVGGVWKSIVHEG